MSTALQSAAAASRRLSPRISSLGTALPEHRVDQEAVKEFAFEIFADALRDDPRLAEVFEHTGIRHRHLCLSLESLAEPRSFAEWNELYVEHAVGLGAQAAGQALEAAGVLPRQVDHVLFVSSTGVAAPSLDAHLANRMGFRRDVRRTPLWGLGCAGGAAGLARAAEFAVADPAARVLLVAVELCSLTFQREDRDRRNLVAASLFGDGAAALLVSGAEASSRDSERRWPELLASGSTLWPDTLDVMGWTVDGSGLHVVFSRSIPALVLERVRPALEGFLSGRGLRLEDVAHFATHPGGPKVLRAFAEALGLPESSFRRSQEVLEACGNMSSPTCLFVLDRMLQHGDLLPGDLGLVVALGPGFGAESVLLRAA